MEKKQSKPKTEKKAKPISDSEMEQQVRSTGAILAREEKVRIMIAPDPESPMWRGSINGYEYAFPKGQLIDVPVSLARLIEQSATVAYERQKLEEKMSI